jgi:hypothetical protein
MAMNEFERVAAAGERRAADIGHRMEVVTSNGTTTAEYTWQRCGLGFVVGHVGRRLQLVAETACRTPCGTVRAPRRG